MLCVTALSAMCPVLQMLALHDLLVQYLSTVAQPDVSTHTMSQHRTVMIASVPRLHAKCCTILTAHQLMTSVAEYCAMRYALRTIPAPS